MVLYVIKDGKIYLADHEKGKMRGCDARGARNAITGEVVSRTINVVSNRAVDIPKGAHLLTADEVFRKMGVCESPCLFSDKGDGKGEDDGADKGSE